MNEETQTPEETLENEEKSPLTRVTPLSKYLAMILFIALPFIGGWIGYHYAPEKIIEVEKIVEIEKVAEPQKTMGLCEMDVVYDLDECWCPEAAIENTYQLDGREVLFCASEGLDKEVLDRIDNLPSEVTPTAEVILPNGMNLEEYSKMRGIEATTFERVGDSHYYKDSENVYVLNEGDVFTAAGLVKTGGVPSKCTIDDLEGCVPEEIGRCQTWRMGGASYGKNERGIYIVYNDGEAELLDIDAGSFKYLEFVEDYSTDYQELGGTGFATDKNNVYVGCGDILEGEDPTTFNLDLYLQT